jgi:SAM-dependent methyltransferase
MTEPTPSSRGTFFEVFESLPRQGPGSREWTARALDMCEDLPAEPHIVDLGCGSGAQTLDLAELTGGSVVAVDSHAPFLDLLAERAATRGLSHRIQPLLADMAQTGLPAGCADLVWSEGALYSIGLEPALAVCHRLLRPGGWLAFTDAVWRRSDVPSSVREVFAAEYPSMGSASDVLALLADHSFEAVGHFTLPDAAWWDDFYTPMRSRVAELRAEHSLDAGALAVLDSCDAEIDMFSRHSDSYAYEFFVARPVTV